MRGRAGAHATRRTAPARRGGAPGPDCYEEPEIPAALHAFWYCAVHSCDVVTKPSLMTVSWMLDLLTITVGTRTEGTAFLPLLTLAVAMFGTGLPCARGTASSADALAIFLIGW